jgi:hypothetical protein
MRVALLVVAVAVLGGVLAFAAQSSSMTEEGYCNLQGRLLTLLEMEWKDRLTIAQAAARNDEEFWKKLEEVGAKFRSARSSTYSDMATTEEAVTRFSADNKDSIEAYLNDHPDLRGQLDAVNARVKALIEQFESVMQSRLQAN